MFSLVNAAHILISDVCTMSQYEKKKKMKSILSQ